MNRTLFAFAAVSSLALAACGTKQPEPTATESPADAAAAAIETAPAGFPTVPANARTTVKYQGAYSHLGADGKSTTLLLGPDDSFTMTDPDGKVTKGTYNWYSDNSRILIKDGDTTSVFAVADGAIYKLADKDAPITGPFTNDVTWRRIGS
jgi:hypothetical protein